MLCYITIYFINTKFELAYYYISMTVGRQVILLQSVIRSNGQIPAWNKYYVSNQRHEISSKQPCKNIPGLLWKTKQNQKANKSTTIYICQVNILQQTKEQEKGR